MADYNNVVFLQGGARDAGNVGFNSGEIGLDRLTKKNTSNNCLEGLYAEQQTSMVAMNSLISSASDC